MNNIIKDRNRLWLVLAIISVCLMGIFAVEITFARTPKLSAYFSAGVFYRALAVHVVFAMIIWLFSFTVYLWHQYFKTDYNWIDKASLIMSYSSIFFLTYSGLIETGSSYLNDYLPVINHPIFWTGVILFMLAFTLTAIKLLVKIKLYFSSNTETQLYILSILITVLIAFSALYSLFYTPQVDDMKMYFQRMFWVPGHIQQFLNTSVLLALWHYLVRISRKDSTLPDYSKIPWIKISNTFLIISALPMLGGLFTNPLDPAFKLITVFVYGLGLGIPVLIHSIYLLRKFKPGTFAGNTFLLSVLLYYSGVIIAYGGMQSDLRITAHYHGVVTALTVALMARTYFSFTEYKILRWKKLAQIQPLVFAVGMLVVIISLFFAGHYGAPRKTFGFSWVSNPDVVNYLNLLAGGAALSILGGLFYVIYCLGSLSRISIKKSTYLVPVFFAPIFMSYTMPNEVYYTGKQAANIQLKDAGGKIYNLYDLLKDRPAVLSIIYTNCPSACSAITASLKQASNEAGAPGKDYRIITFSFDSTDESEDLKVFEDRWKLGSDDWKVYSSSGEEIKRLLASVDFNAVWNVASEQFDHPNVVMVLTPSGKISKYIHGISHNAKTLKLAILEARRENTSLSFYEGMYLRCFFYDPVSKTYMLDNKFLLMLASGGITVCGMSFYLIRGIFRK